MGLAALRLCLPSPQGLRSAWRAGLQGDSDPESLCSGWLCVAYGHQHLSGPCELTFSQGVLCVETPLCDTVTTPGSLPMVSMETPITTFPAHLKSRLEITLSPLSYYFLFPSHEHHMSPRNCQKCGFENSRVCFHFYTPQGSFSAFTLNPCKERFSLFSQSLFFPLFIKGACIYCRHF